MFALALPALLALAGLAVDFAKMSLVAARLQSISDAAALAAARELSLPNAEISQIKSIVANNIAVHSGDTREPVSNKVDVDYQKQQVRVELEQAWVPFFAHFLDATVTPIKARSVARLLSATTKTCVLSLDPAGSQAIYLDKNAVITARDCGIYANSTSSQAIRLDGQTKIRASIICAVGGIKTYNSGAADPEPLSDCPEIPDPLALRSPPPVGGCGPNIDVTIKTGQVPLEPGVYCDGLTIAGNAEVTLSEGVYIIKDGPLKIGNDAVIKGENVGFYLVGDAATIRCTGNAAVELSGRKTGEMAGLLIFEDRAAPLGQEHTISCANASVLTGTIYLPRGKLSVNPNASVAAESAYTAIIAYQIELNEGPDLVLNADYNATDVPVPAGLKSAGTVILTE